MRKIFHLLVLSTNGIFFSLCHSNSQINNVSKKKKSQGWISWCSACWWPLSRNTWVRKKLTHRKCSKIIYWRDGGLFKLVSRPMYFFTLCAEIKDGLSPLIILHHDPWDSLKFQKNKTKTIKSTGFLISRCKCACLKVFTHLYCNTSNSSAVMCRVVTSIRLWTPGAQRQCCSHLRRPWR